MNFYSYKITRDYGFAPNPFGGLCTLACCKPNIRKKAAVGDWIIGTGSIENKLLNHLIYLMKVTQIVTFEEYWNNKQFSFKKPVLNGSLKQIHGDNIYYKQDDYWCQIDSHHSYHGGKLNKENLDQDLSGEFVLISNHFIYLGNNYLKVPDKYLELCPNTRQRNYITINNHNLATEFVDLIFNTYRPGVNGTPINWSEYNQYQLSLF